MASGGFSPVKSRTPSQVEIEQKLCAEELVKSGAWWFLAIAVLSIVISALTLSGAHFSFIFVLGITQVVDAVGQQGGSTGSALSLVVNAFIAGVFVLFWNFARKG